MCGIVGYVGKKDCTQVLLDGLSKLEYRGYDSAGIAVFEKNSIKVIKAKGRIADLENKIAKVGVPVGVAGIGHTRWATHGEPSDVNSHPIGNERVSIVHNGIIENYKQLKTFLISKGYTFESETDTETVAKLIDYYYDGNAFESIVKVMAEIEGSYALGIVFKDYPDTIFAIRKESPLIIGLGKDENFIASDITAVLKYTKNYYLLEQNEIAIINHTGVKVYNAHHDEIQKELQTATWSVESAQKGGYEHFLLKEIHEQPVAIKNTISPRIVNGIPSFEECGLTAEMINNYKSIYIVGCGSAMHAGIVGKYIIEKLARVSVTVDIASEFRYRDPLLTKDDLVIIISQSGETADTLAALKLANKIGATTLCFVNVVGSSIAREADMVIYTYAGPEISVCSSKAYTVQLAVMYLFAFLIAYTKGKITLEQCKKYTKELSDITKQVEICLSHKEDYQYIASKLVNADSLLFIGRGLDYAMSMEGSLKLKEISYIHSEAYAAGELKHGTISLITEGMPVIGVATQKDLYEKTVSNIKACKARGACVTIICQEETEVDSDLADYKIGLPVADDILMPLVTVVPLQLIAYYTSVLRGNDVDKPRNLAKSVTVE